jgi:S-adenosylmethionine synthetase
MPETKTNGYSNGSRIHNGYEMEDNATFLFTSESVGEGHPGKF